MKRLSALGVLLPVTLGALLGALGCTTSTATPAAPAPDLALVSLCFTGNASPNWAGLDFKLVNLTLTPRDGSAPVPLLTPPTGGLPFNLARLDHVGLFLGNFLVPAGAYTGATLTLSTAYGAQELDVASLPDPGFPGTRDDAMQIWNQDLQTDSTIALTVPFALPLVATSGLQALLDLDWDSARPSFLHGASGPGGGPMMWTINFDQVLRQRPALDPAQLTLLPVSGVVYAVAGNQQSFLLAPSYAAGLLGRTTLPQLVTVLPDPVNGALFMDIDTGSNQVIRDLSSVGNALPGRTVRVGGRLQADGSLLATRLWAGTAFELGTEQGGRIQSVNPATGLMVLDGEASTQNGFDTGASGLVGAPTLLTTLGAAPIAPGAGFAAAGNLGRGFQVQALLRWAQTSAQTTVITALDLEAANYHGVLTAVDGQQIVCASPTGIPGGTLQVVLPYLAQGTASGNDDGGNPVSGFSWWAFNSPAQRQSGPGAIAAFVAAASASVDFGGTVGVVQAQATAHALWGDPANPGGWSAQWAVLEALPLPLGTPASGWVPLGSGGSFGLALPGAAHPVTVDVLGSGTATELYLVTGPGPASIFGSFPVLTPLDPNTPAGLARFASLLAQGAPIQVFGVAEGNGHLQAGTVFCYTYTE